VRDTHDHRTDNDHRTDIDHHHDRCTNDNDDDLGPVRDAYDDVDDNDRGRFSGSSGTHDCCATAG
jgi:hypothetical protein